jgi:palmitoyltransferase
MLQLLGLDRFTKGKAMSGMRKSGQGGAGSNPFSLGVVGVSIPLLVPSAGRG